MNVLIRTEAVRVGRGDENRWRGRRRGRGIITQKLGEALQEYHNLISRDKSTAFLRNWEAERNPQKARVNEISPQLLSEEREKLSAILHCTL